MTRPRTAAATLLPLLTVALGGIGCGGGSAPDPAVEPSGAAAEVRQPGPEGSAGAEAIVVAALDSGNAAFEAEEYAAALAHYERAIEADGSDPVAWYGAYLAHRALGNDEAAERAIGRADSLQ